MQARPRKTNDSEEKIRATGLFFGSQNRCEGKYIR